MRFGKLLVQREVERKNGYILELKNGALPSRLV